jgi:hypothetical protein
VRHRLMFKGNVQTSLEMDQLHASPPYPSYRSER